jgi:hypothetical protein
MQAVHLRVRDQTLLDGKASGRDEPQQPLRNIHRQEGGNCEEVGQDDQGDRDQGREDPALQ